MERGVWMVSKYPHSTQQPVYSPLLSILSATHPIPIPIPTNHSSPRRPHLHHPGRTRPTPGTYRIGVHRPRGDLWRCHLALGRARVRVRVRVGVGGGGCRGWSAHRAQHTDTAQTRNHTHTNTKPPTHPHHTVLDLLRARRHFTLQPPSRPWPLHHVCTLHAYHASHTPTRKHHTQTDRWPPTNGPRAEAGSSKLAAETPRMNSRVVVRKAAIDITSVREHHLRVDGSACGPDKWRYKGGSM